MSTVTCELPLPNGDPCGVTAIGLCIKDQVAFCISHQAVDNRGPITNLCDRCQRAQYRRTSPQQPSGPSPKERIDRVANFLKTRVRPTDRIFKVSVEKRLLGWRDIMHGG